MLPGGLKLAEMHWVHTKVGVNCKFCEHLRRVPWTFEYESYDEYLETHGGNIPWAMGSRTTERPIQMHEVIKHTEPWCATAWKYYEDEVKRDPSLAWITLGCSTKEIAIRLARDLALDKASKTKESNTGD